MAQRASSTGVKVINAELQLASKESPMQLQGKLKLP